MKRKKFALHVWTKKFTNDSAAFKKERLATIQKMTAYQYNKLPYRKTVAVIGWGGCNEECKKCKDFQAAVEDLAREVGAIVAQSDMNILTGGGECVMKTALEGFINEKPAGLAFAVRPPKHWKLAEVKPQLPNVTPPIYIKTTLPGNTPLGPCSRNHVNILCADKVIVLYGTKGTLAEATLCGADWYSRDAIAIDFEDKQLASKLNVTDKISAWKNNLGEIRLIELSELEQWLRPEKSSKAVGNSTSA